MDTDLNNKNNKAGNTSKFSRDLNSSSSMSNNYKTSSFDRLNNKMSNEDKLNRKLKNISYISSTPTNSSLNSTGKASILPNSKKVSLDDKSRKKVGGVVLDVETIQDATQHRIQTQAKRNTVIIIILSALLVVSLVYLVLAIIGFKGGHVAPNCKYSITGDAEAEWVIEGKSETEFNLQKGLGRDMIYILNSSINIKTKTSVLLNIEVKVLLNGEPIMIAGLFNMHESLIRVEDTNKFVYQNTITGGGNIHLFEGIDFTEAPNNLTSENVTIEVIANIEKV